MIKNNQTKFNYLHVLLDALVICLSYAAAWYLMIGRNRGPGAPGTLPIHVYFMALIVIVPVYLILYASFDLYAPKRTRSRRSEFANICKANIL